MPSKLDLLYFHSVLLTRNSSILGSCNSFHMIVNILIRYMLPSISLLFDLKVMLLPNSMLVFYVNAVAVLAFSNLAYIHELR